MTVQQERCILTGVRIMNRQVKIPGHVMLRGKLLRQERCCFQSSLWLCHFVRLCQGSFITTALSQRLASPMAYLSLWGIYMLLSASNVSQIPKKTLEVFLYYKRNCKEMIAYHAVVWKCNLCYYNFMVCFWNSPAYCLWEKKNKLKVPLNYPTKWSYKCILYYLPLHC